MVTRRRLLVTGAVGTAAALAPPGWAGAGAGTGTSAPTLAAETIPKYVTRLRVPGTMPTVARTDADEYSVGLRQLRQQVLPTSLPGTRVWGFGSTAHPWTFRYPGNTIEARVDRPVRVTWRNELVDGDGRYLPHLLPVDPALHWANPAGGTEGRDTHPDPDRTPARYLGPVPLVVHLHGGHNLPENDGYPEAWYLPDARDIPAGYARVGSSYEEFDALANAGTHWSPGSARFEYRNDQQATTLWYHDHSVGLTRLSMYAGAAGFYLLRGGDADLPPGVLPGPAAGPDGTPHEIPMLIQDRSFRADGELSYPSGRAGMPFFGTTTVVNGNTWPVLPVQRRRYRFRLLNGCNSRFLQLCVAARPTSRPARPVLPIWQLGSDGGFLPAPVEQDRLALSIGSRSDVLIDFTDVPAGTELYLVNEGPDGPDARGGPADPQTTGQVLKFVVTDRIGPDDTVPAHQLRLPAVPPLGPADRVRRLSLSYANSTGHGVLQLGVVDQRGRPVPLPWGAPVTEQVGLGSTEIWELHNFTSQTHPVHLHQVQFELLGSGRSGGGPARGDQGGRHDTVPVFPGSVRRIKAHFDLPGRYVWHCHILEHEDHDMMRPYVVTPAGAPEAGGGGAAHLTP
ncbi:multicopper oxidase family protein [Micromonospora sp. WMMA1923]|uniref:multicopper oxidase family protein n=1 Tax=Micromonospora sp. WMMA1923 TaxID=3404125 RepID=UPI003B943293